ncbi:MAG TPA: glycosyltransferase family 9 protein [Acidobacteriaceae bacterium]|nr:glycosyltransferase family 9 protein [Acidobacteriaceae bacterium]
MNNPIERVLIYRLGSLGDTAVALPCFHQIARAYPDAERCLLTNIPVHSKAPAAFAVLDGSGLVHGFMRYPIATRNLPELIALQRQIRAYRPQVLVYLTPRRLASEVMRDNAFFRLCGVTKIIGSPLSRDSRTNRLDPVTGWYEPEASRLARLLKELGKIDLQNRAYWDLRLTLDEHRRALEVLKFVKGRTLLACSVGTKVQAKDWGLANWRRVLDELAVQLPEYSLVLIGASEESAVSESAAVRWTGRWLNLCGKLTPRESAAVLGRTRLFVGHDSGPMHLASAVGTPCVAVFAARNRPRVWFPWGDQHEVIYHQTDCWGCDLETCIDQKKKCLTSITPAEVIGAVHRVIARTTNSSPGD